MKYETPLDRKQYVEQIRKSFQQKSEMKPDTGEIYDSEMDYTSFRGLKLRIFFSVIIFVAVLLCYQTNYEFYGFSVAKLISKIETTITLPEDFSIIKVNPEMPDSSRASGLQSSIFNSADGA